MPRTNLVIATCTMYKDIQSVRPKIAVKVAQAVTDAGYPSIFVDGSPREIIYQDLVKAGASVFQDVGKSLGDSKRQGIYHALQMVTARNAQIIVLTEAEKDITPHMEEFVDPIVRGEADVACFTRSKRSLASCLPFRVDTEMTANRHFKTHIGLALDIMGGPIAFKRDFARYYLEMWRYLFPGVPDTYAQHFGTVVAIAAGLRVVPSRPFDFIYPAEQTAEELGVLKEVMEKKCIGQRDTLMTAYEVLGKNLPVHIWQRQRV